MNRELNFEQLQKKLKKVLNPERFRFVVILYPNTNMIDEIKEHISSIYPESSTTSLDLKDKSYQEIAPELYKNNEGFVYINDFDEILNNPDLYNGFNQRRDKIASFNINLICFISLYQKDELFTKAINVIPDLWEFKNTVLELVKDEITEEISNIKVRESSSYSSLGGLTTKDKKVELKKLIKKLNDTKSDELKLNLTYQIATIYRDMGDISNALQYLINELELKNKLQYSKNEISTSYNNISLMYNELGDMNNALKYQKKALSILKGESSLAIATCYNSISLIYQNTEEFNKALVYQKKALPLLKKILGENHPDLATSYNNISTMYHDIVDLSEALIYQQKAIAIREEVLTTNHPDLAQSYGNISLIFHDMGELKKALYYQQKALSIREKVLDDKHSDLASNYLNISVIYWDIKDIKNAKLYIDKAVKILKYNFPNGHPNLDAAINTQSNIYNTK